ncbi:nuclear pore complex protein Nup154-like isoform X2 [Ischnura elegans]|uniref:nuclear pore complex protein Nup154-like isoform X2 n=1 Tax=Ischnura elegans TaxID=197161 RepID=UPI001ED895D3|nr:nuclear pore complex protein Nup154-like isoform X2 [Ischnura elegans]
MLRRSERVGVSEPLWVYTETLDFAGKMLENLMAVDGAPQSFLDFTGCNYQGGSSISGLHDLDYPSHVGLSEVMQLKTINKVPIPAEIMEKYFRERHSHFMMGLFPDIHYAWLTLDNCIYIWKYENGNDVAYFKGITETIVSVGLSHTKPGVWPANVSRILILTTAVEIVLLGMVFDYPSGDVIVPVTEPQEKVLHLLPQPLALLPTDGVPVTSILGTPSGRIFLGSRDGNLYEIVYKKGKSWFGWQSCYKVNHSRGLLSYLIPSFLTSFPFPSLPFSTPLEASNETRVAADPMMATMGTVHSHKDALVQLSVDVTRNLLYTLSEKGDVSVYELGADGKAWSTAHLTQNAIVQQALSVVKTLDSALFRPVISVQAVDARESSDVHMVAITTNGVRLYYSTVRVQLQPPQMADMSQTAGMPDSSMGMQTQQQPSMMGVGPPQYTPAPQKPSTLCLLHVRMPPGFAANSPSHWPTRVHSALYRKGQLVMVNSPGPERDLLWCLSSDDIPAPVIRQSAPPAMSPFSSVSSAMPGTLRTVRSEVTSVLPLDGFVLAVEEVVECEEDERNESPGGVVTGDEEKDMELALQRMVRKGPRGKNPDGSWMLDPPPAVEQHLHPPRKYAVLTNKGIQLVSKLRPVDVLHRLLVDAKGPDSQGLRTYFTAAPDQAGATCLLIACQGAAHNPQVAEWATRAFFMYGGEPGSTCLSQPGGGMGRPQQSTPQQSPMTSYFSPSSALPRAFNPPSVSTPVSTNVAATPLQQSQMISPMSSTSLPGEVAGGVGALNYSHKHNALYLLLGRLLRPIWNLRMVHKVELPGSRLKGMVSGILMEELNSAQDHLHRLQTFIAQNQQLICGGTGGNLGNVTQDHSIAFSQKVSLDSSGRQPNRQSGQMMGPAGNVNMQSVERNSLEALRILLCLCCEVLGLWKVLCLHHLHGVASTLSPEQQNVLCQLTFRDMVLNGQELCSILIENLINSYLGDRASVDAISSKLRDVCPSLYRQEDAACSKANEVLLNAIAQVDKEKRDRMLQQALELCEGVCPHIDLPSVSRRFAAAHFPKGVLRLCLTCASRLDPEGLAVRFYNAGQLAEDSLGRKAYLSRMDCYKEVTLLLDQAYGGSSSMSAMHTSPPSPISSTIASSAVDQSSGTPLHVKKDAKWLLNAALDSDDCLLHVAIYEWMLQRELHTELLHTTKITSRHGGSARVSLETYLKRAAETDRESLPIQDLLWKYYESINNHAMAAKVLHGLATASSSVTLDQRITYLARAVMCMRSDNVGCAPSQGVFLRELEDQLEVARIQQKVLNALKKAHGSAEEAISRLTTKLVDITQLYEDFAEPFGLWQCKLAILHCVGHNDPTFVESIWDYILETELAATPAAASPDNRMGLLLAEVKALGTEYNLSPRCFPLTYITRQLEICSCRLGASPEIVHLALVSLGVGLPKLINIYDKLISSNDRVWLAMGNELHLLEALVSLVDSFTKNPSLVVMSERRAFVTHCQDVVATCLSELYSRPNTSELIEKFRVVQIALNRLA